MLNPKVNVNSLRFKIGEVLFCKADIFMNLWRWCCNKKWQYPFGCIQWKLFHNISEILWKIGKTLRVKGYFLKWYELPNS